MATALYLNQRSHAASDPMRNFRFLVKFMPYDDSLGGKVGFDMTLGFLTVSGLSATTEAIPYREGGFNTTYHYLPGQTTFAPVTMQRGTPVGSDQHWKWFKQLYDAGYGQVQDTGTPAGHFRCAVQIYVLAHPTPTIHDYPQSNNDYVVHQYTLHNAWITNLSWGDLNAQDNAVLLEQITLVHEGLSIRYGTRQANPAVEWGQFTPSE